MAEKPRKNKRPKLKSKEPRSEWFPSDRRAALTDFWAVYNKNYDTVREVTLDAANRDPVFGPIIAAMPPGQLDRQSAESRERLRRAVETGDFAAYEVNLREQGIAYARMRVPISSWYQIVAAFSRRLTPLLVKTYGRDTTRLVAALGASQEFLDRAMCGISEAYLDESSATLRASESNLATTLDSIGDGVIATDREGRVTRMNPVAEILTGWPLDEARGLPLGRVFNIRSEKTGAPAEDPVSRVVREGVVVGLANHTELVARNGTVRPIADSGAPIRDGEKNITGVVLVFRDQTEARTAVEDRFRSIRLEDENLRIKEASQQKSAFLANVSHELRTPLNAILGFTQLIADGAVKPAMPEYAQFLDSILSSGRHLLKLINDILDLAKIEAGRLNFFPTPVHIASVVGQVVASLSATAREKQIHIATSIDNGLTSVVADEARFKQILYNFLSNALKFTRQNGRVEVRARPEDDTHFRIEVRDTGIGIAPEQVKVLFTEFQQLTPDLAKRQTGTGLGLALTRHLVEAQGGRVGVRSRLGEGSLFYAILPRRLKMESRA
ncbi:MAG: PAS domain-containing protein [Deltaproteobacteria bacterium]|nr:PAS domain-containing protein [Deltaproteobacteria bacterium]